MSVTIERSGRVWTVVLSRPECRNAIDHETAEALYEAFTAFDASPDADVAVFWGKGGVFCAGWDLKFATTLDPENPLSELDFVDGAPAPRGPLGPTRLALSKPVIAAVEGPAVAGGMELALWCDLRVMAESAYLGVYCRRWGIPLIDGGTVRLPRLVGEGRALDIIMTGRKVPAEECLAIGAANRLCADGEARAVAEELAHELTRFPQACLRADRRSVYEQRNKSVADGLRGEWATSIGTVRQEGLKGAARFRDGKGRHGGRDI